MQFLVTGYDGKDLEAGRRRLAVREEHLRGAEQMYREKTLLYAAAILDEEGRMIGSMMLVDFPTKEALHSEWLSREPYVTGKVWQDIRIEACRVPGFIQEP